MVVPTNFLGVALAIASAGLWGGGDLSGGLAARRLNPIHVLALASFSGSVVLLAGLLVSREPVMSAEGTLWAMGAGASGALGSAILYRALATGRVSAVAPTAAVVGAGLPVCFGIAVQGWPGAAKLAGFGVALAGIWLVSQSTAPGDDRRASGVGLACLSGLGFGGFFIMLALVDHGAFYMPLALVRCTSLVVALALAALLRRNPRPAIRANPRMLLAGLLAGVGDATGNMAYMLAKQAARLDVATVLAALYPAVTVLLACVVLNECVSRWQWLGVGLCLAAIALISF